MSTISTQCAVTIQAWTTTVDSQGYGNGNAISAGPAQLLKIWVANKSAGVLWACLFNSANATGTPALLPIPVPASGIVVVDFSSLPGGQHWCGVAFSSALTWAASSAAVFSQDSSNSLWLTATIL
jgi:hypothetical protein